MTFTAVKHADPALKNAWMVVTDIADLPLPVFMAEHEAKLLANLLEMAYQRGKRDGLDRGLEVLGKVPA